MPGRYPTINSNLTTRTTLTAGGTLGLSNSDKSTLSAMFPNSPIYSLNETDYRATAKSYLQPDTQADTSDHPHFDSAVDMNYTASPALDDPSKGPLAMGLDSPYYPNLRVPTDPAALEDGPKLGFTHPPNDNYGTGATADQVSPQKTAAIISQATIQPAGSIAPKGQSGANLPDGTVTTHSINDGALTSTP